MKQEPSSNDDSILADRLIDIVDRVWPQLADADEGTGRYGRSQAVSALFAVPLALGGLVWLVASTNLAVVGENWALLLLLVALRYLLGQFVFWLPDEEDFSATRTAQSNVITWSAVFLFGPVALWLDLIAVGIESGRWYLRQVSPEAPPRFRFWQITAELTTTLAWKTLPALAAVALYVGWGGHFPMSASGFDEGSAAILATWVKVGLSLLIIAPFIFFDRSLEYSSIRTLPRLILFFKTGRAWLAALPAFILFDFLGLLAGWLYVQNGFWVYLFLLAGTFIIVGWFHRSGQIARRNGQQLRQTNQLEQLARRILLEPANNLDLPKLLEANLPAIFEDNQLEIRLFPDQVLYRQGSAEPRISDDVWEKVGDTADSYLQIRNRTEDGFEIEALALPIISADSHQKIGGIVLRLVGERWAGKRSNLNWLPAMTLLAAQISATIHRVETFEQTLTAQTEAYKAEVYKQVFQSEMNIAYQRVAQELTLAGKIQNSFLPKNIPNIDGWQISVTLESARETSGDYYDIIPLPSGRIGILIADVADKGFGAALYMALSRTVIRTYALAFDDEPLQVLMAANRRILEDTDSDLFVTVFYGVLDPETGDFTYCNAGHNPPFLWQSRKDNLIKALTRTALPLGIIDSEGWEQTSVRILPGDVMVLYTDGVPEAQDEDEQFFGDEKLQEIVGKNLKRPAEIIEDKVISAIFNFAGDAPQFDDITLMVLIRDKETVPTL